MMTALNRVRRSIRAGDPIDDVVGQHVAEAAGLREIRRFLAHAPRVGLNDLETWDTRIARHLDGVAIAGQTGARLAMEALETPGFGQLFVVAARALEDRDLSRIDTLLALGESGAESYDGLLAAFGWTRPATLRGVVMSLLRAASVYRRRMGIQACCAHRVDLREILDSSIASGDPYIRSAAFVAAGELGRLDALRACGLGLVDAAETVRLNAACAGALLGDRGGSVDALLEYIGRSDGRRERVLGIAMRAANPDSAHAALTALSDRPDSIQSLICGVGAFGDPFYVPWLISRMSEARCARAAGEAFCMLTGIDLSGLELDGGPPAEFEATPNDDPDDENVDMDPDDGLPWPDPVKIAAWWKANASRFPAGQRFFMGQPPSMAHCLHVLKTGYQRQRIAAAVWRCILKPGTPLFPTDAPAWRQRRRLAAMSE